MKMLFASLGLILAVTASLPAMANETAATISDAVQNQTTSSTQNKEAATSKTDAKYNSEIKKCMKHQNKTEAECKKEMKHSHEKQ